MIPAEPTSAQCDAHERLPDCSTGYATYACWYPQMGGYVGKAVVTFLPGARCFDVYVWHDGRYPFHDGEQPTQLHHCEAEQFVEFGKWVLGVQGIVPHISEEE